MAGRKGKQKQNASVNWEVVKKIKVGGGLQIRDPTLVNLALGGKILWKLIHEPTHHVIVVLSSKYRPNKSLINLQNANVVNSTHVWKLCCRSSKFFNKQAYRIPGNSKHTHMWLDRIMGK